MSTTQNGKATIDGILLSLDAANPQSYPGSGIIWYDTSGNGNHFYLYNTPSFDTGIVKNITFDGINQFGYWIGPFGYNTNKDYFSGQFIGTNQNLNTSPSSDRTIELWFKLNNTLNQYAGVFAQQINSSGCVFYPGTLGGNAGKFCWTWDDSKQDAEAMTNKTVQLGEWVQLVVLLRNSYYYTYYVNGFLDKAEQRTTDLASPGNTTWNIARESRFGYYLACSVSIVRMYNKMLSAEEILQNFNANRSRFGL